jgi:PBP1b-binding outer membrane lipoprotein LpoB
MKLSFHKIASSLLLSGVAFGFLGCASSGVRNPSGIGVTEMRADERGFVAGTGIESTDLATVSDQIARKILSTPEIANAKGTPRIVIEPVENATRFPIDKNIFLERIRGLLNERAAGKVRFLDRTLLAKLEQERAAKQAGQFTSSSDPNVQEFRGADFFLTGKLSGLTTRTSQGTSDYVLYSFRLTDARTSEIVFEGQHEIKKQGLEDAAYR